MLRTRKGMAFALVLAIVGISSSADADPQVLSDDILDRISAGSISENPRVRIVQTPDALRLEAHLDGPGEITVREKTRLKSHGAIPRSLTAARLNARCKGSCALTARIRVVARH